MKRLALASLSLSVLAGCTTASTDASDQPSAEPTPQHWICGREYENFAWGYQRRGVVLDGYGNVWRYDFKGTPASLPNPWHAKDLNALTEAELKVRYNGAADTGKHVADDDIARHMALIREAARTPPTEGRHVGADMGATVVYCLARNVPGATYRQVLIDQKGDVESTNPSSAAKELAAWLNGVFKGEN